MHERSRIGGRFATLGDGVAVEPSKVHGLGLIAKEPIPAFTIVTFYAVHAVGQQVDREATAAFSSDSDAEYFQSLTQGAGYRHEWYHPALRGDPKTDGLFIDANPNKAHVAGWVGHLVNDGALCADATDETLLDYYTQSAELRNCFLVPLCKPLMGYVTTRTVEADEELLTTYSHRYWLSTTHHSKSADADVLREVEATSDAWSDTLANVEKLYSKEIDSLAAIFESGQTEPSTGFGRPQTRPAQGKKKKSKGKK